MTQTTTLAVTLVDSAQSQKEVTVNEGTVRFDAALGTLVKTVTDADYTLSLVSTPPEWVWGIIEIHGALTGTRHIVVPANKKAYSFVNLTTGGHSIIVHVDLGSPLDPGVTIPNGQTAQVRCTGTAVVAAQTTGSSGITSVTDDDTAGISGSALVPVEPAGSPELDAMVFWDESAAKKTYLYVGTGLSITGNVLDAAGGGGGALLMETGKITGPFAANTTITLVDTTLIPQIILFELMAWSGGDFGQAQNHRCTGFWSDPGLGLLNGFNYSFHTTGYDGGFTDDYDPFYLTPGSCSFYLSDDPTFAAYITGTVSNNIAGFFDVDITTVGAGLTIVTGSTLKYTVFGHA